MINSLDDVMGYFGLIFFTYIILFVIICVNLFKALRVRGISSGSGFIKKFNMIFDLIIDVLCCMGMFSGLIFQGVLADNNAVGNENWFYLLLIISISSFIIFVINVIVVYKERR